MSPSVAIQYPVISPFSLSLSSHLTPLAFPSLFQKIPGPRVQSDRPRAHCHRLNASTTTCARRDVAQRRHRLQAIVGEPRSTWRYSPVVQTCEQNKDQAVANPGRLLCLGQSHCPHCPPPDIPDLWRPCVRHPNPPRAPPYLVGRRTEAHTTRALRKTRTRGQS